MDMFYMAVVDGQGGPTKRYSDIEAVTKEAERLCNKEGAPVHIMGVVATCKPPALVWDNTLTPAVQA